MGRWLHPTLTDALGPALDAYAELTELAEDVDDEWTYITDLDRRLAGPAGGRRGRSRRRAARRDHRRSPLTAVAEEARAIEDPHRAIDWLSTYPQVVLLALGERP